MYGSPCVRAHVKADETHVLSADLFREESAPPRARFSRLSSLTLSFRHLRRRNRDAANVPPVEFPRVFSSAGLGNIGLLSMEIAHLC